MKIIRERNRVEKESFSRQFMENPSCGFSFPCDEHGKLLPDLSEAAIKNYNDCVNGKYPNLKDFGVVREIDSYIEPAVGICERCGKQVKLVNQYMGACECECGTWYNVFGQMLNSPDTWFENESD